MKLKLDTENIFFTSDWHLFHNNVIKFDNRPFNNVHEMHDILIENWNSVVDDKSIIFFLGDLSFGSVNKTKEIISELKGIKHCVLGNHDKLKDIQRLEFFDTINDYIELDIKDENAVHGWQKICMMHYPLITWNKHHHGAWHLHGHCHQNLVGGTFGETYYNRKVIDVGTNGHDYKLLSLDNVREIMNNKSIDLIDHI